MKKLFNLIFIGAVFTLSAFAQTDYVSYSGPGTIVLTSGETLNGKVTYWLYAPAKVHFLADGKEKDTKYNCDEVKEFAVDGKQFLSVKMKGGAVTVGSGEAFGRLLTAADAKIKIFVSETQPAVVVGNDFSITTSYYASVPGEATAYALSDIRFTPFKKMAKYVEDCTVLADKITNKEKDFTYPMMTTDEARLVVFTNVSREYQQCK
jgi:hypothetical protein